MPALFLTAWPWIKKFGPYLAGALLLLGLYLWIDARGYDRARTKYELQIASDNASMQRGIDAINLLRSALNDQNAKVQALAVDGEQRAREAAAARDAALKANASLVKTQAMLAGVAKRTYSSAEPCTTPAEVMGAKL